MATNDERPLTAWGTTSIPLREARRWRIGPLHLTVARRPWEWAFSWWRDGPWLEDRLELAVPVDPTTPLPTTAETHRFSFGETVDPLELSPCLGDRPFIATPDEPFHVLPDERARAYVSVPLWVQARVGKDKRLTIDVPVVRPQDTWFGSPTRGTLCYASRTAMRLEIEYFDHLIHRALITVEVVNRGHTPLPVHRLKIPVPQLPLLVDPTGQIRTPSVRFTRERDELAAVDIATAPPEWRHMAHPRVPGGIARSMVEAFNSFFNRSP